MATNKSLKRDLKNMGENIAINIEEININKEEIKLNRSENNLNKADNLKNNKSEMIMTSFNVSENVKGGNNVKIEDLKDAANIPMDVIRDNASTQASVIKDNASAQRNVTKNNVSVQGNVAKNNASVQNEIQEDFKKVEIQRESIVPVKALNKDIINEGEDDSMNLKIFKRYMELCKSVGLMPSWPELNKFKDYYVG